MNFLYKINSGYGGSGGRFTPAKIPERLNDNQCLDLGWSKYLDAVDEDDPVWIYFRGPQRYQDGVYVIGRIAEIDAGNATVRILVERYSTDEPLTDAETSARVAAVVVDTWFQQVFLMPDLWQTVPTCSVTEDASSCAEHHCDVCASWRSLPLIEPGEASSPRRLADTDIQLASAYWSVPPRAIVSRYDVLPGIRHTTDLFKSFKTGNENLTYPFALGMRDALRMRDMEALDALVPIPLSPEKAARGEIHRTRLLATQLGALVGVPVIEALQLTEPISKRALQREGRLGEFELRYREALVLAEDVRRLRHVCLVDDASTWGGTLRVACTTLKEANGTLEVSAVTAVQMILRDVVVDEDRIRA